MVSIPSPSDCIGVVGVALGVLGILVSIGLLLVLKFAPWGWYLLVASGTLWGVSWLYCLGWEWEYLPHTRS